MTSQTPRTRGRTLYAVLLAALLLTALLAGCAGDPAGTGGSSRLDGDLETLIGQIYDNAELSESFREFVDSGLVLTEITAANAEYHLGSTAIPYVEAMASEPVMSTSAYALCLLRLEEGADPEQAIQAIRDNVDPFKWVCVGVQEENIVVDHIGDVVFLVMSDEAAESLHASFLSLADA